MFLQNDFCTSPFSFHSHCSPGSQHCTSITDHLKNQITSLPDSRLSQVQFILKKESFKIPLITSLPSHKSLVASKSPESTPILTWLSNLWKIWPLSLFNNVSSVTNIGFFVVSYIVLCLNLPSFFSWLPKMLSLLFSLIKFDTHFQGLIQTSPPQWNFPVLS